MDHWKQLKDHLETRKYEGDRSCVKLFNGPGGSIAGLEQLHIDRFADHLFVLTYMNLDSRELDILKSLLNELYPSCPLRIQHRAAGGFQDLYLSEQARESFLVEEGGLCFRVHSGRGQNSGFFADMKEGRRQVREYCRQKKAAGAADLRVLNLFAYTCSFSVACLAGGADSVDNWDMNKKSLSIGRENHRLNGLAEGRDFYFGHDIFKSFSKIIRRGPYDLAILDPPPRQGKSFRWEKDYPRLMQRLPQILKSGAAVLFCLNAADCGRREFLELIRKTVPGGFGRIDEIPVPVEYVGRYPDRGLKTFFADDYKGMSEEA